MGFCEFSSNRLYFTDGTHLTHVKTSRHLADVQDGSIYPQKSAFVVLTKTPTNALGNPSLINKKYPKKLQRTLPVLRVETSIVCAAQAAQQLQLSV